jgi:hypothetical protein
MNAYRDLLEKNKPIFLEQVSKTPSIEFIEFFDIAAASWINEIDDFELISRLSMSGAVDEQAIKWVKDILISKNIQDVYIFTFHDYNNLWPRPWAKVKLSQDYAWVAPLWKLGRGLYFLSSNLDFYLHIAISEGSYEANMKVNGLHL